MKPMQSICLTATMLIMMSSCGKAPKSFAEKSGITLGMNLSEVEGALGLTLDLEEGMSFYPDGPTDKQLALDERYYLRIEGSFEKDQDVDHKTWTDLVFNARKELIKVDEISSMGFNEHYVKVGCD